MHKRLILPQHAGPTRIGGGGTKTACIVWKGLLSTTFDSMEIIVLLFADAYAPVDVNAEVNPAYKLPMKVACTDHNKPLH